MCKVHGRVCAGVRGSASDSGHPVILLESKM